MQENELLVSAVAVGAIMLYAAHEDFTSDGLKRTQLFLVIGYAIYPLFYGACVFLLWKLMSSYRRADTFVTLDASNLFVWNKEIPLREISSIRVTRGLFFLRSIVITQSHGAMTKVSSIALARPLPDVAARLKVAAGLS